VHSDGLHALLGVQLAGTLKFAQFSIGWLQVHFHMSIEMAGVDVAGRFGIRMTGGRSDGGRIGLRPVVALFVTARMQAVFMGPAVVLHVKKGWPGRRLR
jgi:hypothetical protein